MHTQPHTPRPRRTVLQRCLWAGLALQVGCALLAVLDKVALGTTDDHVRRAYPSWGPSEIATERDAILSYLVAIGVLGALCWLGALWSARSGRGVRTTVTLLFAVGMSVLTITALAGGEAYSTIVPSWLGLTTAGLVAIPAVGSIVGVWMRGKGNQMPVTT